MRETRIRPAQFLWDSGVRTAEALDVSLVHHRSMPRRLRLAVVAPVEERIDDDAPSDKRRAVQFVFGVLRVAEVVGEDSFAPLPESVNGLRIGVEEHFRRIAPESVLWRPRTVHPESVTLAGTHVGQVAVPAERGRFGEVDRGFTILIV